MLGSLKTSQFLTGNVAGTVRPFVALEPVSDVKDNVAHEVRCYTEIRKAFVKDNYTKPDYPCLGLRHSCHLWHI